MLDSASSTAASLLTRYLRSPAVDRLLAEEAYVKQGITEKGGTLRKEGKDRHIVDVNLRGTNVTDSELGRLQDFASCWQ